MVAEVDSDVGCELGRLTNAIASLTDSIRSLTDAIGGITGALHEVEVAKLGEITISREVNEQDQYK